MAQALTGCEGSGGGVVFIKNEPGQTAGAPSGRRAGGPEHENTLGLDQTSSVSRAGGDPGREAPTLRLAVGGPGCTHLGPQLPQGPPLGSPRSSSPSRSTHLGLFQLQEPQDILLPVIILGAGVREDIDEGAGVGHLHSSLDGSHTHLWAVTASLRDRGVSGAAAHLLQAGPPRYTSDTNNGGPEGGNPPSCLCPAHLGVRPPHSSPETV